MKVLVLNGSPRARSDTMHITRAFLEGMNSQGDCEIAIVDVIKKKVGPCVGCFQCSIQAKGECIQKDDQNEILSQIKVADVVIWSFPLYFFSLPSHLKAVLDRTLPLGKKSMKIENNRIVHEPLVGLHNQKHVMISGSGFPKFESNFAPVKMLFHNVYTDLVTICVSESPLFNVPPLESITGSFLKKVKAAGEEFKKTGTLTPATIQVLETPMVPVEAYVAMCNQVR